MGWQCQECTRYWGRRHKEACPLCKCRQEGCPLCLLRLLVPIGPRRTILAFTGNTRPVIPLPKHRSLCAYGTARNCRCPHCRGPLRSPYSDSMIFVRLRRQHGHGRRVAARWVYLLSAAVAMQPEHGCLSGLLIAANVGRSPHVRLVTSMEFIRLTRDLQWEWVWRWLIAVFLQYVQHRCELPGLKNTARSAWSEIFIIPTAVYEADSGDSW